jgi:TolB-like protein
MKGLSAGYALIAGCFLAISVQSASGEDLPKVEGAGQPTSVEQGAPPATVAPAATETAPTAEEIEKAKADALEKAQAEELAKAQAEELRIRMEEVEKTKADELRFREIEIEDKSKSEAIHIRGVAPEKGRPEEMLAAKINELADALVRDLKAANSDLFVASFVDMDRINRSNTFGRYMMEALMEKMHKLGFNVVELRASDKVMAQPSVGMHVLTIQPGEIGNYRADTVLSGTYKKIGDSLEVHAKIVSHVTRKVMSAASFSVAVDKDSAFMQDMFENPLGRASLTTGNVGKGK